MNKQESVIEYFKIGLLPVKYMYDDISGYILPGYPILDDPTQTKYIMPKIFNLKMARMTFIHSRHNPMARAVKIDRGKLSNDMEVYKITFNKHYLLDLYKNMKEHIIENNTHDMIIRMIEDKINDKLIRMLTKSFYDNKNIYVSTFDNDNFYLYVVHTEDSITIVKDGYHQVHLNFIKYINSLFLEKINNKQHKIIKDIIENTIGGINKCNEIMEFSSGTIEEGTKLINKLVEKIDKKKGESLNKQPDVSYMIPLSNGVKDYAKFDYSYNHDNNLYSFESKLVRSEGRRYVPYARFTLTNGDIDYLSKALIINYVKQKKQNRIKYSKTSDDMFHRYVIDTKLINELQGIGYSASEILNHIHDTLPIGNLYFIKLSKHTDKLSIFIIKATNIIVIDPGYDLIGDVIREYIENIVPNENNEIMAWEKSSGFMKAYDAMAKAKQIETINDAIENRKIAIPVTDFNSMMIPRVGRRRHDNRNNEQNERKVTAKYTDHTKEHDAIRKYINDWIKLAKDPEYEQEYLNNWEPAPEYNKEDIIDLEYDEIIYNADCSKSQKVTQIGKYDAVFNRYHFDTKIAWEITEPRIHPLFNIVTKALNDEYNILHINDLWEQAVSFNSKGNTRFIINGHLDFVNGVRIRDLLAKYDDGMHIFLIYKISDKYNIYVIGNSNIDNIKKSGFIRVISILTDECMKNVSEPKLHKHQESEVDGLFVSYGGKYPFPDHDKLREEFKSGVGKALSFCEHTQPEFKIDQKLMAGAGSKIDIIKSRTIDHHLINGGYNIKNAMISDGLLKSNNKLSESDNVIHIVKKVDTDNGIIIICKLRHAIDMHTLDDFEILGRILYKIGVSINNIITVIDKVLNNIEEDVLVKIHNNSDEKIYMTPKMLPKIYTFNGYLLDSMDKNKEPDEIKPETDLNENNYTLKDFKTIGKFLYDIGIRSNDIVYEIINKILDNADDTILMKMNEDAGIDRILDYKNPASTHMISGYHQAELEAKQK